MNLYQMFYDLINQFMFGSQLVAGTYQEMITIVLSCICVIALIWLPFKLVFCAVSRLFGGEKI